MHNSTNLERPTGPEGVALRPTTGSAPVIRLRRESAGNDATHADPVTARQEIDAWARHAVAANGFGDGAVSDKHPSALPTSYEIYQAACTHRAFLLGEIIAAAIQALGAIVRRAYAQYRQRRAGRKTYQALSQLDDRALRDLGFARDELMSVAAETAGQVERTRVRALRS